MHKKQIERARKLKENLVIPQNSTDLDLILRMRLLKLEIEIIDFQVVMQEFAYSTDRELVRFVRNLPQLQKNINTLQNNKTAIAEMGTEEVLDHSIEIEQKPAQLVY
mmetsp:Transcript_15943/g.26876  ORF Transcript_15943/g.26876 Transcript_15943/m.26876 type:complete len:107 (+) Transcript_15943:690-1010(+)